MPRPRSFVLLALLAVSASVLAPFAASAQEPPHGGWTVSDERTLFTGGCYAPSVVRLLEGGYWIFLSLMPPKGRGMVVLKSADGVAASEEQPVAALPDVSSAGVVRVPEGIRFYASLDGEEAGVGAELFGNRMASRLWESGKEPAARVGASVDCTPDLRMGRPAVIRLKDGAWRMFFIEYHAATDHMEPVTICSASSKDGLAFSRDPKPCLVAGSGEADGRGHTGPVHPVVVERPAGGYWMFYNVTDHLNAAWSADGRDWAPMGPTGADGQDADACVQPDGSIRLYYSRPGAKGWPEVHTAVLREGGEKGK